MLLVCLFASGSQAGEVESAHVSHEAGRYSLDLTMQINSDPAAVYALVTDYDTLERISPTIIDSQLLNAESPDQKRRQLVTETCVWFFCFKATMVEDVREQPKHTITTTIVPVLSDYRYGESLWQISAEDSGTRIHFQTTLEPDFWVPPLIGTWLLKRKMRSEAERTILRVEQLTRQHEP